MLLCNQRNLWLKYITFERMKTASIQHYISQTSLDSSLKKIAEKVISGQRINFDEGVLLFEKGELGFLGSLANYVKEKKSGNYVFFNRNFHVEPTNICVYTCSFCSYSRLIKQKEQGWELSVDQILDTIKKWDDKPVTEVHITGGVIPKQDLNFYTDLFRKIKQHRPGLHVKALTPVEYHYIFKKAKIDNASGSTMMKEAGLGSIHAGGAVIL